VKERSWLELDEDHREPSWDMAVDLLRVLTWKD
jgi:hypothetical protein